MLIILTVYLLITTYVITKGLYTTKKYKIEKITTSIQIEAIPFILNKRKIDLFIFLIIFVLLISLNIINLIDVTYCMDHENTNFNYLQRSRQTNLDNNENSYIYWNKIIEKTYGVFNKNFPLEEKLIKEIHTFGSPFYIYYLNNCDLGPSYLEIQDYDKVFEGVSKDIDNILIKQNDLFKQILGFQVTSSTNYQFIYEDIKKGSDTILKLTSKAYDILMFSYNNKYFNELPIIHYSDSILFKILNNKTDSHINLKINSFISSKVEFLDKKIAKNFISLEKISSILNNLNDTNFLNKHWDGTQIIIYPEEIQNKNYNELRYYAPFKDYNSSNYIKKNIYDFCQKRPYEPLTSGFKFKDNSISYTPNVYIHGDDSDDDYYDY